MRTNNFSLGDKLKDSRPSLSHSYCALKGAMNRGRIVPLPFMSGTGPHNVNRSDLTKMSSVWHLFLFAVVLIFLTFFFPCTSVVLNLGNFVLDFLCPHAFQSLMSFRNFVGGIWQMCILVDKSMGTRLRHLLFLSHNFHLFLHLLIPTHQLPPNPIDFYPVYTFSYY